MNNYIKELNEKFRNSSPSELLAYFFLKYGSRMALSSSLSIEDQMLTDILMKISKDARVFTLDTGRLFPETYTLIDKTNLKYGKNMELFFPDYNRLQDVVKENGLNFFYESIEKRKLCCQVRKMEPLKRAFNGLEVWVCGLRKEQSVTRSDMQMVEWDESNQLIKLNPLINFSEDEVWDYIRRNNVPYNKLHDKGYPSIGCQPCTRAVEEGDDIRSGRWWWEDPAHKECGLHRKN